MKKGILVIGAVFVAWAGIGGGFYALLDHKGWPKEWLIAYGFGTMAAFLIWAVLKSRADKKARAANSAY